MRLAILAEPNAVLLRPASAGLKDAGHHRGGRACRAGRHVVVFLERGPLYLVAAAATGEPVSVLRLQLHLLHSQILCILTDGFQKVLARNARFDTRRLLGEASAGALQQPACRAAWWHACSGCRKLAPLWLRSTHQHAQLLRVHT